MSHVLSDKEVADKAEAAGGACWPRINRTTSKAYAASANGKERDRRYRATEKGKAAGKRFCQPTGNRDQRGRGQESAGASGEHMGEAQQPTCRAAEDQRAANGPPWAAPGREPRFLMPAALGA
jgi:hypothetical protein